MRTVDLSHKIQDSKLCLIDILQLTIITLLVLLVKYHNNDDFVSCLEPFWPRLKHNISFSGRAIFDNHDAAIL